jgi:malate dehydrogenase (oxaloacetate-decarboxylating)
LVDDSERLKKANQPAELAMKYHPFYRGKIEVVPKCPITSFEDFAVWYTPGVAAPCKAIEKDRALVYDYTNKWNTVAVVTDGTRVLGLGDIGPEAGYPVMEGKALLFKYLGGVDAFPICLATKDPKEIITAVKWLQPSFGGINLEDIEQPKCFEILETLRAEAQIPVWHDDQQGTATVILAGLVNALKIVGKKMHDVGVTIIGAGAAGLSTSRLLVSSGVPAGNLVIVDSKGILNRDRTDLQRKGSEEKWKWCLKTNTENKTGGMAQAIAGADACISMAKSGPGIITKEIVRTMANDSILFACANPVPEIWPWEAKEAGARIFATGRSDFPNQLNNSLGFPGIFRGVLDVRARTITDEMCLAAAYELADLAEERGLREDRIVPTMDDWEVFPREAAAVGMKAIEQGVARVQLGKKELYEIAFAQIKRARDQANLSLKGGLIQPFPK